jgi:tRNA/rRNA methyltransferase
LVLTGGETPDPAGSAGGGGGAPAIVLVAPQLGQNIGTAARAMANFALHELRLVAPREGWPNDHAVKAASGAPRVIDEARVFATVEAALGEFHYVAATTARRRDMVKPVLTPASAAREMRARIARGERVCFMFGPERTGLDNEAIALADAVVMAPVNPAFASLNLSQAVLIIAYEWFRQTSDGSLGRETAVEPAGREGIAMRHTRPATKEEYLGLFAHLESELDAAGFLRPAEKRPGMVRNLRNLIQRQQLTEQDVRTLRGVIAALAGAKTKRPGAGE